MPRLLTPVLLVLLLPGCAGTTGESSRPGPETRQQETWIHLDSGDYFVRLTRQVDTWTVTLDAPVARVWSELPAVYQGLGLVNAGRLEDAGRVFAFQGRIPSRLAGRRPSTHVNCGRSMTGDLADEYDVRLFVRTAVESAGEATVVSTTLDASATPRGASGAPVSCSSTGQLERAIAEALAAAVLG